MRWVCVYWILHRWLMLSILQGTHEAIKPEGQSDSVAQVSAAVKAEPAEASTADVQNRGTSVTTADGLASAAPVNGEASRTVDAGEGPAAKRAKHTDMAESEAANAPVIFPTPTPTPAAAEPSVAQGGSTPWTLHHMPNIVSQVLHALVHCALAWACTRLSIGTASSTGLILCAFPSWCFH